MPEAWLVTEYPNGFPPKETICHDTQEVYQAKRLPWNFGFYTVYPIYPEPKNHL